MHYYLQVLLSLFLLVVGCISLVLWLRQFPRFAKAGLRSYADSLLPAKNRERPFWGVSEIFIMFGSFIVAQQLLLLLAVEKGWFEMPNADVSSKKLTPDAVFVLQMCTALANCASIGLLLLWMRNISRDNIRKFGLSLDRSMIVLGLKSAVMILPPVLVVSGLVSWLVTAYEHQVLDVLEQLRSPRVFSVIFVGTAIIVPIAEEILFRGLIQGSLQRLADRFVNGAVQSKDGTTEAALSTNELQETHDAGNQAGNQGAEGELWAPVAYWPVFAASFVFAVMHVGQGAAPIPLFLLSLGLGYLYRQTGSLIPCIVVHMVLNSTTLLASLLE
nr:CPBP family intramembrane glutamic endopeptidase [Rubripirellula sp.]